MGEFCSSGGYEWVSEKKVRVSAREKGRVSDYKRQEGVLVETEELLIYKKEEWVPEGKMEEWRLEERGKNECWVRGKRSGRKQLTGFIVWKPNSNSTTAPGGGGGECGVRTTAATAHSSHILVTRSRVIHCCFLRSDQLCQLSVHSALCSVAPWEFYFQLLIVCCERHTRLFLGGHA